MKKLVALGICSLGLLFCDSAFGVTVITTLDASLPPNSPAYTASTGLQTGRLIRVLPASNCDAPKGNPGLLLGSESRRFDAYVFTAAVTGCVAITLTGGTDVIFAAVYNSSGFVPAGPSSNYLADVGASPTGTARVSAFFNVVAGQQFTVVVSEVNPGAGIGTVYTLTINSVSPTRVPTVLDSSAPPANPAYVGSFGPQAGRLKRNVEVSDCAGPKPPPGLEPNPFMDVHHFESYRFTASRTGCVTVTVNCATNVLFSAAYNNAGFQSSAPDSNYAADAGTARGNVKYSFNVVAGQQFTIVVHEAEPGEGIGEPYTLRVSEAISQTPYNFDGDNKTDLGIFRSGPSEWWIFQSSTGTTFATQFGAVGDRIVPGDYTGDAKTDVAVWRPATGTWFVLRSEDFSFFAFPFGTNGDTPTPGDYDADGKADAAVFRPSTSTWYVRRSIDGGTTTQQFGAGGDVPVQSDYDGDGRTDVAIYRPSAGQWWLNRSTAGVFATTFGASSDKPVPGDYTGDGKIDIAFWRPTTGEWFVLRSDDLSFYSFAFGQGNDLPAPGDFEGDGLYDATVFRPSSGTWFSDLTTGPTLIRQFGANGDQPVPNAFVP